MTERTKIRDNAIMKFGMKMTMKRTSSCVLLSIVSAITAMIFAITAAAMRAESADASDYSQAGQILMIVLACIHYGFCVVFSPAISSSAISSERERQTLDVMLCSQMSPRDIVMGKFYSSISWITLISVSLLPSYAVIFIFGGVPAYSIFITVAMIIWTTAVCSAISIMMSAAVKRSAGAVTLSYLVIFGIVAVNFMLVGLYYGIFGALDSIWYYYYGNQSYTVFGNVYTTPFGWYDQIFCPVLFLNPIVGFVCALVAMVLDISEITSFFNVTNGSMIVGLIVLIAVNFTVYSLVGMLALKLARNALDPMKPTKLKKSEKKLLKKQEKARKAQLRQEAKENK